jgi:exodeoxyribonuclease V alpha subunit
MWIQPFGRAEPGAPDAANPSLEGLKRWLGSGAFPGLGPALATRIVDRFGADTVAMLDTHPDQLETIPGLRASAIPRIQAVWRRERERMPLLSALLALGISLTTAERTLRQWGPKAETIIRRNPYALMELWGIGFAKADQVAASMGVTGSHPHRLLAAGLAALNEAARQGHCYLPESEWLGRISRLTTVDPMTIAEVVAGPHPTGAWVRSEGHVALRELDHAERAVEQRLMALAAQPVSADPRDAWQDAGLNHLTRKQWQAVRWALERPVSILTGLPGTGKTTTVRAIVEAAARAGERVLLAAPTGKAAKRLQEATGQEAMTVHRLLEYHPDLGYQRHAARPLAGDLVVVDESSMLDIELTAALLDAIELGRTRLLLVGDHQQLPSVGPGRVLRDCLESAILPTTTLTDIQRQAAHSGIVQLAHLIQQGLWPRPSQWRWEDCRWVAASAADCARIVAHLAPELQATFGEVQVLSPMRKGPAGVAALNEQLKQVFNPHPPWTWYGWSPGDRVMQIRNNYELEVMNGEVGVVVDRSPLPGLVVRFDQREVVYPVSVLDELTPAWAMTIHKAQGSEWPAVIVVCMREHYILLRRELLYTALTRATRCAVLIGDPSAYQMAVRNVQEQHRYSRVFRTAALR